MKSLLAGAFAATLLALSAPVAAQVVSGDFRTESNLPTVREGLPLVYQNQGAVLGAGYELNGNHLVSNPSSWTGGVVFVDWDALTNIVTLDSQDTLDFQTFDLFINNITFGGAQKISGISLLGNGLTNPGITPTWTFTDNSLRISYSAIPDGFLFSGGTASFQIALDNVVGAVPEPQTWAMMIMGFGMVGGTLRRRGGLKTRLRFA